MTPDQYQRAKTLFNGALEKPVEDRTAFLENLSDESTEVLEEVRRLLSLHHDSDDDFLESLMSLTFTSAGLSKSTGFGGNPETLIGTTIGNYQIKDVLGTGGMGVVYRAEQEKPRRTVALKVIKPGAATASMLRRFEHEAETLGRLQHPGIAQIYEAGVAETSAGPQPFFAMELIEGRSLSRFASQEHLTISQRLELIAAICDAVHHAHQRGVIHRDLKPGNILVAPTDTSTTDVTNRSGVMPRSTGVAMLGAQPKVLDFGVARMVDTENLATMQTDVGQLVGTIPYMSPEQVAGDSKDLDIRSDVYALGVICYELLAGKLPYDVRGKTIAMAARVISEEDPTRLGTSNRHLRGDIESILFKALEKDRARRYSSAAEFANDIRRFLRHEPVMARPAGTAYHLAKFARRNRALVCAVAIAFIALTVGFVRAHLAEGVAEQRAIEADQERIAAREAETVARAAEAAAERARSAAELETDRSLAVQEFLVTLLQSPDPAKQGHDVRVVDVLDQADALLAERFEGATETRARMYEAVGSAYFGLGLFEKAKAQFEKALASINPELVDEEDYRLIVSRSLAMCLTNMGDVEESLPILKDIVERRIVLNGPEHQYTLNAMDSYAAALRTMGDLKTAVGYYRKVHDYRDKHLEPGDELLLLAKNNLATLLTSLGELEEAKRIYDELLEGCKQAFGPDDIRTLSATNNFASLLFDLKEYERAEKLMRHSIDVSSDILPPGHPAITTWRNTLAMMLMELERLTEAEAEMKLVLSDLGPIDSYQTDRDITMGRNMALVLMAQGRQQEALPIIESLLTVAPTVMPADHHRFGLLQHTHGRCLMELERHDEAETPLRRGYQTIKAKLGNDHVQAQAALTDLIDLMKKMKRDDAVEQLAANVIE